MSDVTCMMVMLTVGYMGDNDLYVSAVDAGHLTVAAGETPACSTLEDLHAAWAVKMDVAVATNSMTSGYGTHTVRFRCLPPSLVTFSEAGADEFGLASAVEGDTAMVFDKNAGEHSGSGGVHVYWRDTSSAVWSWSLQANLVAADGAVGDQFGGRMQIEGNTAVFMAPLAESSGASQNSATYVFARSGTEPGTNTWSQQAKLVPGDADAMQNDFWSTGMSLSGEDRIIHGLALKTVDGVDSGSAYIFERSGGGHVWSQQARLVSSNPKSGGYFGSNVAIAGNMALVSAHSEVAGGSSTGGVVYIFERSSSTQSWSQQALLQPLDWTVSGNNFGSVARMSGGYALVHSVDANYIFARSDIDNSWTEEAILLPSGTGSGAHINPNLFLSDDYAVVVSGREGEANIYKSADTAWPLQRTIDSGYSSSSLFGSSVDSDGISIIIGARDASGVGRANIYPINDGLDGGEDPCGDFGYNACARTCNEEPPAASAAASLSATHASRDDARAGAGTVVMVATSAVPEQPYRPLTETSRNISNKHSLRGRALQTGGCTQEGVSAIVKYFVVTTYNGRTTAEAKAELQALADASVSTAPDAADDDDVPLLSALVNALHAVVVDDATLLAELLNAVELIGVAKPVVRSDVEAPTMAPTIASVVPEVDYTFMVVVVVGSLLGAYLLVKCCECWRNRERKVVDYHKGRSPIIEIVSSKMGADFHKGTMTTVEHHFSSSGGGEKGKNRSGGKGSASVEPRPAERVRAW